MEIVLDGKNYVIKTPGSKEIANAKKISSIKFREYLEEGLYLRDELESVLAKRGAWNDEKRKNLEKTQQTIEDLTAKLEDESLSIEFRKQIAEQIQYFRIILTLLNAQYNELYKHTVESKVDDDYFDSLVSECLYNEDGTKVYKSLEDYKEKATEELAITAATKLAEVVYGINPEWKDLLPEKVFLKKLEENKSEETNTKKRATRKKTE